MEWFRRFQAFLSGAENAAANARGRLLEQERKIDRRVVLSLYDIAFRDSVFLAGYDAGGSALVILRGDPEFMRSHSNIKGIIAVESPLWSAYTHEVRRPGEPPAGAGGFVRFRTGLANWFSGLRPKKTAFLEAIPGFEGSRAPGATCPLLFLVSDRALGNGSGRRYEGVYRLLRTSPLPLVLAAVDGAGPLDYSDFPRKYPLISALFPGRGEEAWTDPARGTASIIANFAAGVLESEFPAPIGPLPQRSPLPSGIHLESRTSEGTDALHLLDQRIY
jgi:hypothetical protein